MRPRGIFGLRNNLKWWSPWILRLQFELLFCVFQFVVDAGERGAAWLTRVRVESNHWHGAAPNGAPVSPEHDKSSRNDTGQHERGTEHIKHFCSSSSVLRAGRVCKLN